MDDIIKYIWSRSSSYKFSDFENIDKNKNLIQLLIRNNRDIVLVEKFDEIESVLSNGAFLLRISRDRYITIKVAIKYNELNHHSFISDVQNNEDQIIVLNKRAFIEILQKTFRSEALFNAKNCILKTNNNISAKNISYKKKITLLVFLVAIINLQKELYILISSFISFSNTIFKFYLCYKSTYFFYHDQPSLSIKETSSSEPMYTILFPLYKEVHRMKHIVNIVKLIKYPKDKLDVKIIIEEDDYIAIKEAGSSTFPECIDVITVPNDIIKTKPKALNYAMSFVLGDYLTVYDAEDVPDPDQIHKALEQFKTLDEEYMCLQAKLDFYNENENLITKLISLEYKLWFNFILKGLCLSDIPIVLGGTSNHINVKKLREIGLWDPYNVTEDAELGIRIYINGYKTKMFDSITLEEAPINVTLWFNQRVRWIKGFYQTFLTYMLYSNNKLKKLTIKQKISIYLTILFSTVNFILYPISLFYLVLDLDNFLLKFICFFNIFLGIVWIYVSTFYIYFFHNKKSKSSKIKNKNRLKILFLEVFVISFVYFYFFLHSIAAYKAIYELIRNPFKWNKTTHGLTKIFNDLKNKN